MVCLDLDLKTIFSFSGTLCEDTIVSNIRSVEDILKEYKVKSSKTQNIIDVLIETLQNMLNYSYPIGSICEFRLFYEKDNGLFLLESCNFIDKNHKNIIESKISEVKRLDSRELRELSRKKIRTHKDNHEKGAGVGFIVISKRVSNPIEVQFLDQKDDTLKYVQKLLI